MCPSKSKRLTLPQPLKKKFKQAPQLHHTLQCLFFSSCHCEAKVQFSHCEDFSLLQLVGTTTLPPVLGPLKPKFQSWGLYSYLFFLLQCIYAHKVVRQKCFTLSATYQRQEAKKKVLSQVYN